MSDFVLKGKRVFVAGHGGMVGSACVRRLQREDVAILTASRGELDLTRQQEVETWMARERPQVVIIAAAKVGGILANDTQPVEFLQRNLAIASNLIKASFDVGVEKLLFLGSSCIYPRESPIPIPENALLSGPLEPTNEWYALAKIAGIKLCQAYRKQYGADFISAMPSNLYGPGDNFHPTGSHVIPALLRRFHEAATVGSPTLACWGSGRPRREFLYVDDLADACVFLLQRYSDLPHINVGTGEDVSISELAEHIKGVTGYRGEIVWDTSKPDGMMLKCMDVSRLQTLGWHALTSFESGLLAAYKWYLDKLTQGSSELRR